MINEEYAYNQDYNKSVKKTKLNWIKIDFPYFNNKKVDFFTSKWINSSIVVR